MAPCLATSGSYYDQPSSALSDEDDCLTDDEEEEGYEESGMLGGMSAADERQERKAGAERSGLKGGSDVTGCTGAAGGSTGAAAGQQERQGAVARSQLQGGSDAAALPAAGCQPVDSGAGANAQPRIPSGPIAAEGPASAAWAARGTPTGVPPGTEVSAVRCRAPVPVRHAHGAPQQSHRIGTTFYSVVDCAIALQTRLL